MTNQESYRIQEHINKVKKLHKADRSTPRSRCRRRLMNDCGDMRNFIKNVKITKIKYD